MQLKSKIASDWSTNLAKPLIDTSYAFHVQLKVPWSAKTTSVSHSMRRCTDECPEYRNCQLMPHFRHDCTG